MNPDDAVDRTIRNRRSTLWPVAGLGLLFCGFWLGVCGCVVSLGFGEHYVPVLLAWSVVTLVGSFAFAAVVRVRNPVERIKLGDRLERWPGGGYAPSDLAHIEFGPDPAEDYHDHPLPFPLCQATITPQMGRPLRLIVSTGDAARLREWAADHGIPVSDPGGYSCPARPVAGPDGGGYPTG